MKVFVRTSSMQSDDPDVVAVYGPSAEIDADAHGPGVTMIDVPPKFIESKPLHGESTILAPPRLKLKGGWRSGNLMKTEARRRIAETFDDADQIAALRNLIGVILEHGVDEAKWPAAAKERKAEIDRSFDYIHKVNERARAIGNSEVAINPASDSSWPQK